MSKLVATIIFQHCLNPLGQRVHQSFTGCHWSPLPLLHDDITELVDVRDKKEIQGRGRLGGIVETKWVIS